MINITKILSFQSKYNLIRTGYYKGLIIATSPLTIIKTGSMNDLSLVCHTKQGLVDYIILEYTRQ